MPTRLRWQLTLSHLAAIGFTLLCMAAAIAVVVTRALHGEQAPVLRPALDARVVAAVIREPMETGAQPVELEAILRGLARGSLAVPQTSNFGPDQWQRYYDARQSFQDIAYIAVIGPDGSIIASTDDAGAGFSPPERSEWAEVTRPALSGERDLGRLAVVRSGEGPVGLGAFPVIGQGGRRLAVALVAKAALPPDPGPAGLIGTLVVFVGASLAALAGAFVFALVSASVLGYLLSRRLVGRLERLGSAAESIAGGDLTRRVDEGSPDEVGLLARRFNHMAQRLSDTLAEVQAEKQKAEDLLKAKRELVANVSHELRTPLTSIRGHTESLLMGSVRPDERHWRDYVAVIHRESEELARLIDDLFLLSTTEAEALPMELAPVPLAAVIEEVAESIRPVAQRERRITVLTSVPAGLPPVRADRRRVVQIIGNLVRNALRYTPEGGLVSVRASRLETHAVITVEDTGAGIAPDDLTRVFERFYRGNRARDRASGGAGLGLAIVRELTEAMGGNVAAESTPGSGSRFSFTLPFA